MVFALFLFFILVVASCRYFYGWDPAGGRWGMAGLIYPAASFLSGFATFFLSYIILRIFFFLAKVSGKKKSAYLSVIPSVVVATLVYGLNPDIALYYR